VALEPDRLKAEEGLKSFALTGQGPVVGSIKSFTARRKDGSTVPVERSVASFRMRGRWYAVGSVRDITERTAYEARLRELATTDALTGLPNRRHFMNTLSDEFLRSRRYGHAMALLMLDADRFKAVNDVYGHDVGDETLRVLARTCRAAIRQTDTPGRLGGEEFAVLLPETDRPEAEQAAERLRQAVAAAAEIQTGKGSISITVSIGVAVLTDGVPDADALLKRADEALYLAKERGRNRVAFADF
jgi:diguanylate cyclase (GGDEF)-like protein